MPSNAQIKRFWLATLKRLENKARVRVSPYFVSEAKKLIRGLKGMDLSQDTMFIVNNLVDWEKEAAILSQIVAQNYADGYSASTRFIRFLKPEADISPQLIGIRLQEFLDTNVADQVTKINNTTKKQLRNIIATSVADGDTRRVIAEKIKDVMINASTNRARVIANTEVHSAIMAGSFNTASDAALTTKTWNTVSDESVRSTHVAINGVTVQINELFPNNLMYPGDPNGAASEVIGCRCFLTYE